MSSKRGEGSRSKSRELPQELKHFVSLTRQLKKVIHESNTTLAELQCSGKFDFESLSLFHLCEEDETFVSSVVSTPPTIIVFGQTFAAKVTLVNRLFGEEVLRVPQTASQKSAYRLIRFKHGQQKNTSLSLPDSFELVNENLIKDNDTDRNEVPECLIRIKDTEHEDPTSHAIVDVSLNHSLLAHKAQVVVAPHNWYGVSVKDLFEKCKCDGLPIVLYALEGDILTRESQSFLLDLRTATHEPVIFIDCCFHYQPQRPPPSRCSVDFSSSSSDSASPQEDVEEDSAYDTDDLVARSYKNSFSNATPQAYRQVSLWTQLRNLGFLSDHLDQNIWTSSSYLPNKFENINNYLGLVQSFHHILQWYLVQAAMKMHALHLRVMEMFIIKAFDMQRDILITPKRIDFARKRENDLFESLKDLAEERQSAITKMIQETVSSMKEELVNEAAHCDLADLEASQEIGISQSKAVKQCTQQIQDLVLTKLNSAVVERLVGSVDTLQESYLGTLERCLESLEKVDGAKEASVSIALKQILNAAYQVEVHARTNISIVRVIWERMKEILQSMKPFKTPPTLDEEWKKKVALTMINNLDEAKLAKSLCSQFKTRLQTSHDSFSSSLKQLEIKHSGRLEKTEEHRMKVRKLHAPRLARLALESTSFRDRVIHGMPKLEREIGRGQYGVVFSCKSWGGLTHCAVKSVVPPDDKHWNDLAMEFHYTRSIPEHERIVAIRGSVIDQGYGGVGCSPAVLLIMERLQKDLHTAIKNQLDLLSRLQVALDVVEGIRYLHSLGLVHRDVKLKNVLLDKQNRGKITDLGFCKPEAMMSGSIVGTPIHMAPELFTGKYDSSVDIYAFGILFWYISAGHVKLPLHFEQCHNKDHLWSSVKRGTRPERLTSFDDDCWNLMQSCWAGEPAKRPLLGEVQQKLETIHENAKSKQFSVGEHYNLDTDSLAYN